jgi:ATP-binding cassette subfamily F protein 3
MLHINNLTYRMMGRLLIENATLAVPLGAKIGFVGRNGTGKTTLFHLITGDYSPEAGSIKLRRNARIGQVAQEAPGNEISLIDTVLAADIERTNLLAEAETATDPGRIAEIHERLGDIQAHSAESRAGSILNGLGFDSEAQKRPCSDFSGGWRMRVALAAVLFSEPDLLLLDEPTNYLDLEGALWLESYITRYPYTVIMISHDRDMLNRTATSIVHLENCNLTAYKGNYDFFEKTRSEKMLLQSKMKVKQDAKRQHMEAYIDRFRYKASKARQAQSRIKALEKMQVIAAVSEARVAPISFPNPKREAASPIINMENVSVGYEPGKPILKGLDLRIDADDRIALLGANGNGKSTFAKLIANRLDVQTGKITRADKMRIAMFAQHQMDDLIPNDTAYDHVRALMPGEGESKVRARVAQLGLGIDKMETKACDLSGGEKARLLLGLATFHAPHLLILDEPTNHLDIDSREALIMALNAYRGAVILISHDRSLVEASAERLWLVNDGTVLPYDGDLDDYRRLILRGPVMPDAVVEEGVPAPKKSNLSGKERRKLAAARRIELAPLRKKIKALEAKIESAQEEQITIGEQMSTPAVLQNSAKMVDLSKSRGQIDRSIETLEAEWMVLSEQYETEKVDF